MRPLVRRRRRLPATKQRSSQRGSALVVSLIALTGLVTLGGLTVLAVQGGVVASGHERHKAVALYAAESGAAAAMVKLRQSYDGATGWTAHIGANGVPLVIAGNGARPGEASNLMSADMNAWYEVEIVNNRDDPGYPDVDQDGIVLIRATGHGPNGATAQVEWRVASYVATGNRPCPGYGQKGMAEDGAGRNDCLSTIVSTDVATYSPGGAP